jgi:hypothetical protein
VVELSRFRAELSRGRRLRRADLLFGAPDPKAAIRALPGDEFYYVIHELGFPDAGEILRYGTAEQVQAALDFALWDRDQLSPAAMDEWLSAMADAPTAALAEWAKGIDVELLALFIRRRARVYDLTLEEPPDEPEGALFSTPDGFFVLDLLGDEDTSRATHRLLDALYRHDHPFTRRVLVGTRGELDVELEEHAYTWRSGRMADLGFTDYYAALEVYRELDPAMVRVGGPDAPRVRPLLDEGETPSLRLPMGLVEKLSSGSPFARAIAGVSGREELANLQAALVALSNRVLAADRVTPGDDDAVAAVLARMAATLDLAIEFLSHGKTDEGVLAVRTVPLVQLHRLGVSLVGKVRRLASTLTRDTPFSHLRGRIDLFEADDAEVLAACGRLRPVFPRVLESPPVPGERPFGSLDDILVATAALERAAAALTWLLALGVRPEDLSEDRLPGLGMTDPRELDAGVVARTWLARRLLDQPAAPLTPLDTTQASALRARLAALSGDPEGRAAERARLLVAGADISSKTAPSAPGGAVMGRWIDELFAGNAVLVNARQ